MTAKITASTTSGLVLDSDMSGSLALVAGGVTVATLNGTGANAGIQLSTNMAPAFSAYGQGNQSLSTLTWTKVTLAYEEFDTNGNFDSTTNYRFTPTVAGYYQINATLNHNATVTNPTRVRTSIYKNGSQYKRMDTLGDASSYVTNSLSCVVYLNGSTDYIELYGYHVGGSGNCFSGESSYVLVTLSGSLIRSS